MRCGRCLPRSSECAGATSSGSRIAFACALPVGHVSRTARCFTRTCQPSLTPPCRRRRAAELDPHHLPPPRLPGHLGRVGAVWHLCHRARGGGRLLPEPERRFGGAPGRAADSAVPQLGGRASEHCDSAIPCIRLTLRTTMICLAWHMLIGMYVVDPCSC